MFVFYKNYSIHVKESFFLFSELMLIGFFIFVQTISSMGGPVPSTGCQCPQCCCQCNNNQELNKVCYHYGLEKSPDVLEVSSSKRDSDLKIQASSLDKEQKESTEQKQQTTNTEFNEKNKTTRIDASKSSTSNNHTSSNCNNDDKKNEITKKKDCTTTTTTPCSIKFNSTACVGGLCKIINFVDKKIGDSTNILPSSESVANAYDNLVTGIKWYNGGIWKVLSCFCKLNEIKDKFPDLVPKTV